MANNWTSTTERYNYYGLIAPTDMQMNWIGADLLRVQWNDIYHIDVFVEVWASINGANPVLLGIAPKGATSIDITTDDSNDYLVFIRTAKDGAVSQFSKPLHSGSIQYYFIDPAGVDDPGRDGSNLAPWRTLAYACTRVTTPGEIIHINAGTYTETITSVLAEGVSILGIDEATTIITTAAVLRPMISMISATEGVLGNQTISNITIDGADVARSAIDCRGRSNVIMHDCTIQNFSIALDNSNTVNIAGRVSGTTEPSIYATGVAVYDCTFNNCGQDFLYSTPPDTYFSNAALVISGMDGALIYNNVFTNDAGHYGYGIRCINGYLRGVKIYDNNIQVNLRDAAGIYSYAFAIELWTGRGGNEIYRNTCTGGIDIAGYGWNDAYGYGYAVKVYENSVILAAQPITIESGILLESGFAGGAYVYRNYVKNFQTGLVISLTEVSPVQGITDMVISYNIFDEIGQNATMTGYGMQYNMVKTSASYTPTIRNIKIHNNLMTRAAGTVQIYGIQMVAKDSVTGYGANWINVDIANNLSFNVYAPCKFDDQIIDTIRITNNLFYNATNDNRFVDCIVTNQNVTAAPDVDPLFVGAADFHLQAGSPCINAGTNVDAVTDFDGVTVGNPPEIGPYEYV